MCKRSYLYSVDHIECPSWNQMDTLTHPRVSGCLICSPNCSNEKFCIMVVHLWWIRVADYEYKGYFIALLRASLMLGILISKHHQTLPNSSLLWNMNSWKWFLKDPKCFGHQCLLGHQDYIFITTLIPFLLVRISISLSQPKRRLKKSSIVRCSQMITLFLHFNR